MHLSFPSSNAGLGIEDRNFRLEPWRLTQTPYNMQHRDATTEVTDRRQMSLPSPARSPAKIPPRVSYCPAGSFPGARFGKYHRTIRQVLDRQMRGQRLQTPACEVSGPTAPHRLAFFLQASADPGSPRL